VSEEIQYFVELMDNFVEENSMDRDLWAYREERRLAAVLRAQVDQFFQGLECAVTTPSGKPDRAKLLQLGLAKAVEYGIETDDGDPELFNLFAFMSAVSDRVDFDADYRAGFAPDGSISILIGPDLPSFAELGIGGTPEHDAQDLRTTAALARVATEVAARIAAFAKFGVREDHAHSTTRTAPEAMSDQVDELEPEPESETEEFYRLVAKAQNHFRTWWMASEDDMVSHLATVLARHGLISTDTELARALSMANLMTLWAMHVELAAHTDEGTPGDWVYSIGDWAGDGLSLEQITLLNAHFELGWPVDDEEYEVSISEVCTDIVRTCGPRVVDALMNEFGDSFTFAYLWASRLDDTTYPLEDDVLQDILNGDVEDRIQGFQWVQDGMRL